MLEFPSLKNILKKEFHVLRVLPCLYRWCFTGYNYCNTLLLCLPSCALCVPAYDMYSYSTIIRISIIISYCVKVARIHQSTGEWRVLRSPPSSPKGWISGFAFVNPAELEVNMEWDQIVMSRYRVDHRRIRFRRRWAERRKGRVRRARIISESPLCGALLRPPRCARPVWRRALLRRREGLRAAPGRTGPRPPPLAPAQA